MATKPSRVVTYNEELPSIKSHDLVILISPIRFVGLECKCPSRHQYLILKKSSPYFMNMRQRDGFKMVKPLLNRLLWPQTSTSFCLF